MKKSPETDKKTIDERTFTGTIILNYKNGHMRIVKKKPNKSSASEIPIALHITLKIPKWPEITAKGEFELPGLKVKEMLLDAI